MKNCGNCHKCLIGTDKLSATESMERLMSGKKVLDMMMILCPDCGNKRCPKASDHELACTNSNASGQAGSIYE